MFKVNEEIRFSVEQDGESCELTHVFRPATPSEWLDYHRALLEYGKAGEDNIEAGIRLAQARFDLWAKLIQDVRGYANEQNKPLNFNGDPGVLRCGIPPEHQLQAIGMWLEKKVPAIPPSAPASETKSEPGSRDSKSGAPAPEKTNA